MTRVVVWIGGRKHARRVAKELKLRGFDAKAESRTAVTVHRDDAESVRAWIEHEHEYGTAAEGGAE